MTLEEFKNNLECYLALNPEDGCLPVVTLETSGFEELLGYPVAYNQAKTWLLEDENYNILPKVIVIT